MFEYSPFKVTGGIMFYKGIIHSYNPDNKTGSIKLQNQNETIDFELGDIANSVPAISIGEPLKFIVVEREGQQHAKFIIRLNHLNASDSESQNSVAQSVSQDQVDPSETLFQSEFEEVNDLIAKRFQAEQQTVQLSSRDEQTKSSKILSGITLVPEQQKSTVQQPLEPQFKSSKYPMLDEKNILTAQEVGNAMEQQPVINTGRVKDEGRKPLKPDATGTIWNQPLPEVKTAFQLKFNDQKIISPSRYEHIEDFRSQNKKGKKGNKQFNPWILASIVPILVVINLGVWGLQKYQAYQADQETKARLYSIEQQKIIKKQKEIAEQH